MDKTGQIDDVIVEEFESESDCNFDRLYQDLKNHQKMFDKMNNISGLPNASNSSCSDSESE